jgi:signal peptidase I
MNTAISLAIALGIAVTIAWRRWLQRRWIVVTVQGDSMAPTLQHGQQIVARRAGASAPVRRGDVVVFRLSPMQVQEQVSERLVHRVKRVAAVAGDPVPTWMGRPDGGQSQRVPPGCIVVAGDNARSQDSRHLGYVDGSAIVAVLKES